MPHTIFHRVGFHGGRDLIYKGFVSKRVLEPGGRAQGTGKEGRCDGVNEHLLTRYCPGSGGWLSGYGPVEIASRRIHVVGKSCGRLGRGEYERWRGKSRQNAADDVAGDRRLRTIAFSERPALIRPDDYLAHCIDAGIHVDDVCWSKGVSRYVLVLARILHAHRLTHGLRQQRCVIAYRV